MAMSSDPRSDSEASRSVDRDPVGAEVEVYEDDGNVVNPLAWVEASRTVRLVDAA